MKIILKKTSDIKPYINNPRKQLNIDKVATSIKEFGFRQPIVLDKKNVIVVGHTRYQAAKQLGLKKIPVHIVNFTKEQAKAYRIADNRVAQDSGWDNKLLNLELEDLQKDDFNIDILGFEKLELETIFNDPKFIEPTKSVNEGIEIPEISDTLNQSQIRMVQLFFDSKNEPIFIEMIKLLQKEYKTNNITDTIYKAVENEYNTCKTNIKPKTD